MVSETEIFKFLEAHLNENRFKHSLRVMETAERYARIWGIDHEKAHIAGLLHDCGKWKSKEDTLKTIKLENISTDRAQFKMVLCFL